MPTDRPPNMCQPVPNSRRRPAHTLVELVVALVASSFLLAGLGSVMMIARQVALTPSAAERRARSSHVVQTIGGELRFATLILQQNPRTLEFVVADRNADGAAERIKYEWSGVADEPLYKTLNGGTPAIVLDRVRQFQLDYSITSKTSSLPTTVQSTEAALLTTGGTTSFTETLSTMNWLAQEIDPLYFPASVGGINKTSATAWNATRFVFSSSTAAPFVVALRETGALNGPTTQALARASLAAASANQATLSGATGLHFSRKYAVVFRPDSATSVSLDSRAAAGARTLFRGSDYAGSWSLYPDRQVFGTLYGTYSAPGPVHTIERSYVARVGVKLQSGEAAHARIDASIPLGNSPELLAAYWRADFDADPTTSNSNADAVADWAQSTGTFDPATLVSGVWQPASSLQTQPASDFTTVTTIDACCQNTSVGGNGAVLRINADRHGGQFAPLIVYLQRQSDGTQTLTFSGKSSDANTTTLFTRSGLPGKPVRFQLTILPQHNVVNLHIQDVDQGTFSYPTYAPSSNNERFLTIYEDTSQAEFDYIDVRVATNY